MLTQEEADILIKVLKSIKDPNLFIFPKHHGQARIDVVSNKTKDQFIVTVNRKTYRISKCSYQERHATGEVLLRLDIDAGIHSNPDDTLVPSPHLHIYREGFGDRWAIPLPEDFSVTDELDEWLIQFLGYCRIVNADALALPKELNL